MLIDVAIPGDRKVIKKGAEKILKYKDLTIGTQRMQKGKGKVLPKTGHEGPEGEQRYTSTLSLTLALDGVGGQTHAPAALPLGKRPGTHCIGGWVGPRARLNGCEKSRPYRNFFFLVQKQNNCSNLMSYHTYPFKNINKMKISLSNVHSHMFIKFQGPNTPQTKPQLA